MCLEEFKRPWGLQRFEERRGWGIRKGEGRWKPQISVFLFVLMLILLCRIQQYNRKIKRISLLMDEIKRRVYFRLNDFS